jgi:hypothetical protein
MWRDYDPHNFGDGPEPYYVSYQSSLGYNIFAALFKHVTVIDASLGNYYEHLNVVSLGYNGQRSEWTADTSYRGSQGNYLEFKKFQFDPEAFDLPYSGLVKFEGRQYRDRLTLYFDNEADRDGMVTWFNENWYTQIYIAGFNIDWDEYGTGRYIRGVYAPDFGQIETYQDENQGLYWVYLYNSWSTYATGSHYENLGEGEGIIQLY